MLEEDRSGTKSYYLRPRVDPQRNKKDPNLIFQTYAHFKNLEVRNFIPPRHRGDYNGRFAFAFTQMSAREGIKRFQEKAIEALITEWKQLDEKQVFTGIKYSDLNPEQRKSALRLVQLIKQKRCGKIKGRTCADGRKQRDYILNSDATSPTVSTEGLLLTLAIDAYEKRYVATCDISGAFLHSDMDEEVYVVVDGVLVEMLLGANADYKEFVHTD